MAKNCPNCHSVKSMVDELHSAFATVEVDDHCKLCGYRHRITMKRDEYGNPVVPTQYTQETTGGYGIYVIFDPITTEYLEMNFLKPTDIFDPVVQNLKNDSDVVFISVMTNDGTLEILKNENYARTMFDDE